MIKQPARWNTNMKNWIDLIIWGKNYKFFQKNMETWIKMDNGKYRIAECDHECTSNCRREGCGCLCGEFHGNLDEGDRIGEEDLIN